MVWACCSFFFPAKKEKKKEELSEFLRVLSEYHVLLILKEFYVNLLELAIVSPERSQKIISNQIGEQFFHDIDEAFYAEVANSNESNDEADIVQQIRRLRAEAIAENLGAISRKNQKFLATLVNRMQLFAQLHDEDSHNEEGLSELLVTQLCAPEFFNFYLHTIYSYFNALKDTQLDSLKFSSKTFLSQVIQDKRSGSKKKELSPQATISFDEEDQQALKKAISKFIKKKYPLITPTLRKIICTVLIKMGQSTDT